MVAALRRLADEAVSNARHRSWAKSPAPGWVARGEVGGPREIATQRCDSATLSFIPPLTQKGRPKAAPHICARTHFPTLVATDARSPSFFRIRLPGYCLPLFFHKLLTVHRFLEASDAVVGESAPHGRVGPHQCSEPERRVARRFLVPTKEFEAPKLLLARTSDVAIGLAYSAPANASAAIVAGRRRFAVISSCRRPATASAAASARASHESLIDHLAPIMDAGGPCLASPCSSTSLATL
jgi:hypothetical protein